MKILHILHRSIPGTHGYAIRSREIVTAQLRNGMTPMVVTSPSQAPGGPLDAERSEMIDGVRHFRTCGSLLPPTVDVEDRSPLRSAARVLQNLSLLSAASRIVGEFRPDVVHGHSPFTCGLIAGRVGGKKGVPSIYEVRGLWEDSHTGRYGLSAKSLRYKGVRALENAAIRRVDRVIVICAALRDELIRRGVAPGRISVVPNGVDTGKFVPGPSPRDLVQRLGLGGKIVAGYIGSFFVYEGLDLLVRAFADLAEKAPLLRLLLVGDGEQRALLEGLAAQAGVRERVIFTGRIPHSETEAYYRVCDVLALPRRDTPETRLVTPLKPLEIMAMAKPLLAADIGGHREMIDDGRTGLLFKAGDVRDLEAKLMTLTSDAELMRRLGENGLEWVRRERDWNALVKLYKEIYEDITSSSKPPGRFGRSGSLKESNCA